MAHASGVTLVIDASRTPIFDGVLAIAGENRSGGLGANQEHFAKGVRLDAGVRPEFAWVLYDPQTSGGLLIAAAAEWAGAVERALTAAAVPAHRIGVVEPRIGNLSVVVRP
jgi:selenide,water dikinase